MLKFETFYLIDQKGDSWVINKRFHNQDQANEVEEINKFDTFREAVIELTRLNIESINGEGINVLQEMVKRAEYKTLQALENIEDKMPSIMKSSLDQNKEKDDA